MSSGIKFEKIFQPVNIGEIELKNRIVMPPMGTNYADEQGQVTDRLIAYYAERAKGGAGLIIVEITCVDAPSGKYLERQLCIHNDDCIHGLHRLVDAVHAQGAKIALQLHHSGRNTQSKVTGLQPVAPSPIAGYGQETPRELSIGEIEHLVIAFTHGAKRAKQAGFDALELHCAHGYLLSQFLSPLTNRRSDKYGGGLEGRLRFIQEILAAIKETVGRNYPVSCRINGDEGLPGGFDLLGAKLIARGLENAGADAIHVSAGAGPSTVEEYRQQRLWPVPLMVGSAGCYIHLAKGIKEVVNVPVIAVGRINTPILAEEILQKGEADLVSIGRGLIADAYWPQKAASGEISDIRPCIVCAECNHTLHSEKAMACAVNPVTGHESEYQMEPAKQTKKVLVVGAGPAGMEAARVAALRGHEVILCEKRRQLGGNLLPAAILDLKAGIRSLTEHLSTQLRRLRVVIELGYEVTSEEVERRHPAVIILATGSVPEMPQIPGIERDNVANAVDVLMGEVEVPGSAVVVGGGLVGCEVAAFLAQKGVRVTLVTRRNEKELAPDMIALMRRWLFSFIWPDLGIEVASQSTFAEVTDRGLTVTDRTGNRRLVEGDTVVFALGFNPNNALASSIEGKVPELYQIGDCAQPRRIRDALREGFEIGLKI